MARDLGVSVENAPIMADTASGVRVNLNNFKMGEYFLTDMLRALAFTCRFNGQIERFYSVAQHSVILSHLAEDVGGLPMARAALLHDGEEALTGDLISPIKYGLPGLAPMANAIRAEVFRWAGLPVEISPELHHLDRVLCACEKRDLQPFADSCPSLPAADPDLIVNPMGPYEAFEAIKVRYRELWP